MGTVDHLESALDDADAMVELAQEENDAELLAELPDELDALEAKLAQLEFRRMFSGEVDENNAFLDIQAGSGGTEAQDWAEMLLRMYLKWGERKGFTTEVVEQSPGDVAGIKGATIQFTGEYAFGWF